MTTVIPTEAEEIAAQAQRAETHEHAHPPMITRKAWGEYMNKAFTVRNFAMPCGHKLLVQRTEKGEAFLPSDPKTNCNMCWFLYFQNNGNMTQIADQCFQEAGRDVLERSRGKKFVKYFLMFMSTMARFQKEQAAAAAEKEAQSGNENLNPKADDGTTGGSNTAGGGNPSTDSGEPGLVGEAQEIGGLQSDTGRESGGTETAFDEGQAEGLESGSSPSQQGLDD